MIQQQYINKQLITHCTPIEIRKIVAENDEAYTKLLEVNNNIECENYGAGVYFNEPEIARGLKRSAMGRIKET